MYIRRVKTINIPFKFHTVQKATDEKALLNSGATENFMDEEVWSRLNIGRFKLLWPLTVHNIDGTKNHTGKIEFYCWLKVHYQGWMTHMKFYLTSLGGDNFILGYPFLYTFNPIMDWQATKLPGGAIQVETTQYSQVEWLVDCYQKKARQ